MSRSLFAAVATMALSTAAFAAPFVSVDLDGGWGATQDGFLRYSTSSADAQTYSSVDLITTGVASGKINADYANTSPAKDGSAWSSASAGLNRIRTGPADAGAFTYANLYKDLFLLNNNNGNREEATLTIRGLDANTQYDLTVYSYDNDFNNVAGHQLFVAAPANGGASGNIAWGSGAPTSNSQYALTLRVTSSPAGELSVVQSSDYVDDYTNRNGRIALNGFELAAVPEPVSLGVLTLGSFLLVRRPKQ